MKVDQNFDKIVEDHVTKNQRRTICISIRGTQAVLSGEENCVDLVKENLEDMTVGELLEAMKLMDNDDQGVMRYKTTEEVVFPPFNVKFKGRLWTLQTARDQLGSVLQVLGFGKRGIKKFKVVADEPEGWPDEYSFETFVHPSHANMKMVNDIVKSILKHHGFDADNHPFIEDEPPTPVKVQSRKRKALEEIRDETENIEGADDNDNSKNEEEVAGPIHVRKKQS